MEPGAKKSQRPKTWFQPPSIKPLFNLILNGHCRTWTTQASTIGAALADNDYGKDSLVRIYEKSFCKVQTRIQD